MKPARNGRDPLEVLGDTIRRLRRERGLTQNQLGALAETHGNYIGLIERGERNPTLLMIHRLARALKVPPTKLLEPDEPQSAQEPQ